MKKLLPFYLLLLSLTLTAQEVISVEEQFPTSAFILQNSFGIAVDYDVANYAVTYTTTDAFGQPDTATGLLSIPSAEDVVFPLAVYNHGTVDSRDAVLSVEGNQERFVAQAISAYGFITLSPDYLGLGGSDGLHPYLHAATEASAGRDMIIAVRAWLDDQEIPRNDQVFVTGYSQGGHASMALHRLLEESADGPSVTAAAHLSGAYIVRPPSVQALAISEPDPRTLRFALNQIIAYENIYNLYGGVDSLFKEPYLAVVQNFVAEDIDLTELGVQIDSLIRDNNAILGDIFVDAYVTDILDMDPELFSAYGENTVLDWAPEEPTLLYYCNGDEVVSPVNATIAFDTMMALGSTSVIIEDGGGLNHFECVQPAALRAVGFFLEFADVYPTSLGTPVERPEVRISPNPATAGSEIRVSGVTSVREYVLYDQSGRRVVQGTTDTSGRIVLPAALARGVAVVHVGLEDGTSVVRRIMVR